MYIVGGVEMSSEELRVAIRNADLVGSELVSSVDGDKTVLGTLPVFQAYCPNSSPIARVLRLEANHFLLIASAVFMVTWTTIEWPLNSVALSLCVIFFCTASAFAFARRIVIRYLRVKQQGRWIR